MCMFLTHPPLSMLHMYTNTSKGVPVQVFACLLDGVHLLNLVVHGSVCICVWWIGLQGYSTLCGSLLHSHDGLWGGINHQLSCVAYDWSEEMGWKECFLANSLQERWNLPFLPFPLPSFYLFMKQLHFQTYSVCNVSLFNSLTYKTRPISPFSSSSTVAEEANISIWQDSAVDGHRTWMSPSKCSSKWTA